MSTLATKAAARAISSVMFNQGWGVKKSIAVSWDSFVPGFSLKLFGDGLARRALLSSDNLAMAFFTICQAAWMSLRDAFSAVKDRGSVARGEWKASGP